MIPGDITFTNTREAGVKEQRILEETLLLRAATLLIKTVKSLVRGLRSE